MIEERYFSVFKNILDYLENKIIALDRKAKRKVVYKNKVEVSQVFTLICFVGRIIFKYNQGEFRDFREVKEKKYWLL